MLTSISFQASGQAPAEVPSAGKLESRDKVRMVQVDDHTVMPIFKMQFKLPEGVPKPKEDARGAIEIREDQNKYKPFYVNFSGDTAKPSSISQRYALLVIDVSGSMKKVVSSGETRYEAAKSAARAFLEKAFEPGVDYVAVVPFESHGVVAGVQAASFVSDPESARRQIDALPDPAGNTGLFSATSVALNVLDRIKKQDISRSVTLVVLTDGKNDVKNKGDDEGLLDGEEGLAELEKKVASLQLPVTVIGFGDERDIDVRALRTIDSQHKVHLATSREVLADLFQRARQDLVDQFQLAFDTKWTEVAQLPKGRPISFQVSLKTADGREFESLPIAFDVPPFGNPGFEDVLKPDELAAWRAQPPKDTSTDVAPVDILIRRLLIMGALGAVLAVLWFGMPRLVWPERYLNWQPPSIPGLPNANLPNVPRPNMPNIPNMANMPRPAPARGAAPASGKGAPPPRRGPDPSSTIAETKVTISPKKGMGRPAGSGPPPGASGPPRTRRPADETVVAGGEAAASETDPWGYDPPADPNKRS
jgi:Ca-activated chloride channel family protein